MKTTEEYLRLFEEAIDKQANVVGRHKALVQAKRAGLGVSREGHIISCVGNPALVLIRLVKYFTEGGNLEAMAELMPLIDEIDDIQEIFSEQAESSIG
ncbi:MAG: hypothetical protein RBT76_06030 [candidate division Zixibacteria bacterium]|jgi:hypothetical protein|nr:hypothetical protein [candidate division Zixibacteria bacterium]